MVAVYSSNGEYLGRTVCRGVTITTVQFVEDTGQDTEGTSIR